MSPPATRAIAPSPSQPLIKNSQKMRMSANTNPNSSPSGRASVLNTTQMIANVSRHEPGGGSSGGGVLCP